MSSRNTSSRQKNDEKVHVAIRCRPMNDAEKKNRIKAVVETNSKDKDVQVSCNNNQAKTYKFDKVFGPSSKQVDVYRNVVAPHIDEVLSGYNCTVLAYGQTGTGKTFTMEGERSGGEYTWEDDPRAGIIPRTLSQLFDRLEKESTEFSIHVSLLEIYNEVIYDLLSPTAEPARRRIYDDNSRKGSVIIADQTEVRVQNRSEVYDILEQGAAKRRTDATLMNEFSSRSHSVFTVTVHSKEISKDGFEEEELVKIGKLNLVDLAGSENIGRSGAVDQRAREAGNINQSLLTLGRCITALVDHAPHVPYRESRLTRILQDSLGGSTKTSIIGTISPGIDNLDETLSTLDYASRAKNIQNKPIVNRKMTKRTLIKQYDIEIEQLRRELMATREKNGVYMDKKQYDETTHRLEELEATLVHRQEELEKHKVMFTTLSEEMRIKSEEYAILQHEFEQTHKELVEQCHLQEVKGEHGAHAVNRAQEVVRAASELTRDMEKVHDKVERLKTADDKNMRTAEENCELLTQEARQLNKKTQEAIRVNGKYVGESLKVIEEMSRKRKNEKEELSETLQEWKRILDENMSNCTSTMSAMVNGASASMDENTKFLLEKQEHMAASLGKLHELCLLQQKAVDEKCQNLMKLSSEMEAFTKNKIISQHGLFASHAGQMIKDFDQMIQKTGMKEEEQGKQLTVAMDTMLKEISEKFSDFKKQQLESRRSHGVEVQGELRVMRECVCEFLSSADAQKEDLESGANEIFRETNSVLEALHQESDDLTKHSVQRVVEGKELMTESSTCMANMFGNLQEDWKDTEEKIQLIAEDSTESTASFSGSALQLIQETGDGFFDDVTAITASHTNMTEIQEEMSNACDEGTDKLCSNITKLCRSDLIHVQPTGETPARKEYPYPTDFRHLPPNDELLKSFHQMMKEEEEIAFEQEQKDVTSKDLDEEKMSCTSDSAYSDSSSACEALDENLPPAGGGMPFFMAGKMQHEGKPNSRLQARSKLPLRSTQNNQ